jgi:Tol biopolymer transport system component
MTIAYLGRVPGRSALDSRIFLRPVDEVHAIRQVSSPEPAFALAGPFFSADGKWLGFTASGLYKMPLSGGQPTLVAESRSAGGMKGAVWTDRGIVFSPAAKAGLFLVGENGGNPEPLTVPDASQGEVSHRWPSVVPDGRHLLFTIKKEGIASFDQGEIALLDLETKSWKTLLKGGSFGSYLPTGHIVFARGGAILAVPFDLGAEKVTGAPVTVLTNVMMEPGSGAAQFSIAQDAGALLYVPGGPNIERRELVWFDRHGEITPVGAPLQPYYNPQLSPDGNRIATTVFGATDTVVVYDVAHGSSLRASSEGNCTLISWDPEGRRLLNTCDDKSGARHLYLTADDGTGTPRPVLPDVNGDSARAIVKTADGVGVVYGDENSLYLSRIDGGRERQRLTSFGEVAPARPAVSPDGRWLAYDIDVSGSREVYVRPFPAGNGMWQISHGGGIAPRWAPRGDELLYLRQAEGPATWLMSVRVSATASGISAAAPKELVEVPAGVEVLSFHPDGERILGVREVNWFDQVKAKAPTH